MNRKDLSKKLKTARIDSGLKQEEIAKLMRLPISAISVIENGTRKVDVLELVKFAQYYNKPIEWFFKATNGNNSRRWYDKNAEVSKAISLLRKVPVKYQKGFACAIIGFLKESGLVK